ncbi:class I SAM-dependent methyltransferase [Pasteurellaceae bacterium 22721_9_1]
MQTIHDIDFAQLYRNHIQLATREPKQPSDWDEKAKKMQHSCFDLQNDYVQDFLSRMDLQQGGTLLDVGCGGGAIALSVAPYFQQVYALDYSQGMLNLLQQRAEEMQIHHVKPILRSWEQHWDDIPECDVCVSSRSSMIGDLQAGLNKLNAKAKRAVYMSMTVDKDFIDREILRYIGRDGVGFPNYIYAVNMLYQQGYRVSVDFINNGCGMVNPEQLTLQDFIHSVKWSIGSNLSETEIKKLKDYFEQNKQQLNLRPTQRAWAFLSWHK